MRVPPVAVPEWPKRVPPVVPDWCEERLYMYSTRSDMQHAAGALTWLRGLTVAVRAARVERNEGKLWKLSHHLHITDCL
jgi:hypothetical protein